MGKEHRIKRLFVLNRITAVWVPQETSHFKRICGVLLYYSFTVAGTLRVLLQQPQNHCIKLKHKKKQNLSKLSGLTDSTSALRAKRGI